MIQVRSWSAVMLVAVLGVATASAQTIRSPGFDRGNRFEGLVSLPIAGSDRPALDLISFTGAFETFSEGVDLRVRFFLPASIATAQVVAQELSQDRFYWMESKSQKWTPGTWSVFGPWPTRDVIVPKEVAPSNIGVVVFLDNTVEGRASVAPAFVEHSAGAATMTRYRVQLRPVRTTLSAVTYRLERIESDRAALVETKRLVVERPNGRPFRIELDSAALPEARYRLTVVGDIKNDSVVKVTRQYEFEHRTLPH
jgi:hypothetical protein